MIIAEYKPRYLIDDYVTWEGDWELWSGVAVSLYPPATFRHQRLVTELALTLGNQLAERDCACSLVAGHDWRIADDTVVRPDVMIVCDPFDGDFLDRPPTLIAEVLSPATEDKDRNAKRRLYAAEGVKHYLIVEPESGGVELLGFQNESNRETGASTHAGTSLSLHRGCVVVIPDKVVV